ncbi:hypothetical protein BZL30_4642 [Mycobacterium kansasii]|uniref:Uncharacterized protein n=1 Tax=Mycobacterium kansasii TaxID=1768 RepID=A0A1V3X2V3_MYCKA|nr:hypothetical protein BZL30_4642 [Mycobacterium kansasii]
MDDQSRWEASRSSLWRSGLCCCNGAEWSLSPALELAGE